MTERRFEGWRKVLIAQGVILGAYLALWCGKLTGAEAVELLQSALWAYLAANVGSALTGRIQIATPAARKE